jgi:hypothetical protein
MNSIENSLRILMLNEKKSKQKYFLNIKSQRCPFKYVEISKHNKFLFC